MSIEVPFKSGASFLLILWLFGGRGIDRCDVIAKLFAEGCYLRNHLVFHLRGEVVGQVGVDACNIFRFNSHDLSFDGF